jgi:DNA-binding beta-propeller fold protein YncE
MAISRLHTRPIFVLGAAVELLLFTLVPLTSAQGAKLERPVMTDSNVPGTELFVLDASGWLHELRVADHSLQEIERVALPAEFTPADMTFQASSDPALLIAGTLASRGVVLRFSPTGKMLNSFSFRNICSGIDFGPTSQTGYVATSDSNEIYRIDVGSSQTTFETRISGAIKLGPVAFDEKQQEIYVADVVGGRIYQYSIRGKTSKILTTGLSTPTAIVFDSETSRLFIADPGLGGIYVADTRAATPTVTLFVSSPLRSPYGMALISNNRIAVVDYSANSVLVFSAKGEFLFRFPAE